MRGGAAALPLLLLLAGPAPIAPRARSAEVDAVHVVRPGETLWQIAAELTGDPHRWPELYRANRDQIKDPSTLYPGQRLAIPDLSDAAGSSADPAPEPAPVTEVGSGAARAPERPAPSGRP